MRYNDKFFDRFNLSNNIPDVLILKAFVLRQIMEIKNFLNENVI